MSGGISVPCRLIRLRQVVRRPAAVFLMTARPGRTCVVQQTLADIPPNRGLPVQSDGIGLLDLDGSAAATTSYPKKVLGNLVER